MVTLSMDELNAISRHDSMTVKIFFHTCRYVAWNMHEAQEGQYDFNGNNDLVSFIQMAQSSGLLVIVRAGESIFHSGDYITTMDDLGSSLKRIVYLQNEPVSLSASKINPKLAHIPE